MLNCLNRGLGGLRGVTRILRDSLSDIDLRSGQFSRELDEGLKAEGSFSINENDEAYIYGRASVSNLTYWPFGVLGQAYISSDHSAVCYHYYENKIFTVYWAYRLVVDENPFKYEANPRYGPMILPKFDPETQAMPKSLGHLETLWVNVNDLPVIGEAQDYHMTAYTRIDADFTDEGFRDRFSWKDCRNSVRFTPLRPPGPRW